MMERGCDEGGGDKKRERERGGRKRRRIRFVCYRLVNDPYTLYYCNYIK